MSTFRSTRPQASEYSPAHESYIRRVPDGDIVDLIEKQLKETLDFVRPLSDREVTSRRKPAEWNIKEIIGHLSEAERILSCRALRFARADYQPLPGWDQDDYMRESNFTERSLQDLTQELEHLRRANVALFRSFTAEALARRGKADGKDVSVRALLYILAGHERHHLEQMRQRLPELRSIAS
ncbi:MAG TPA: DinB family protein [Terriglobales bacterium]|nr:DinB family protein [Terriglobales bacterium]